MFNQSNSSITGGAWRHASRGLVIAALAATTGFSAAGAVQAQTISYADAMTTLSKDCGADVKKFCHGLTLGGGKIEACLQQHGSPTCTTSLAAVTASIATRQAAQASVIKLCRGDAARHCKGVVGEENILGCLLKTKGIDTGNCNQAITDAGWR